MYIWIYLHFVLFAGNPWLSVDLQNKYYIKMVKITNRDEGCKYNMYVQYSQEKNQEVVGVIITPES